MKNVNKSRCCFNLYLFLYFFSKIVRNADIIRPIMGLFNFYRSEIGIQYTSTDVKNLDFKRFLKFQISLHCNKNQPNHYLFHYFFEIRILIRTIISKRNFIMRFLFLYSRSTIYFSYRCVIME